MSKGPKKDDPATKGYVWWGIDRAAKKALRALQVAAEEHGVTDEFKEVFKLAEEKLSQRDLFD